MYKVNVKNYKCKVDKFLKLNKNTYFVLRDVPLSGMVIEFDYSC